MKDEKEHVPSKAEFEEQLKKLLPPGYSKSKRVWSGLTYTDVWVFPPLEVCREHWKRYIAQNYPDLPPPS